MAEADEQRATFTREGGQVVAVMRRSFEAPPATLWTLLTDAARLPEWLAPGSIELRRGGRVRLDFADSGTVIDSQVSALEAGRLLEYSWSKPGEPPRPIRWELAPAGEGTALMLRVGTPPDEDAARACAGFEAHLEMLAAALAGAPIAFPFQTFKTWREAYRADAAAV